MTDSEPMLRFADPVRRFLLLSLLLALPATAAFVVLLVAGVLPATTALVSLVLVQLAVAGLVALLHRDVVAISRYVEALLDETPPHVPRPFTQVGQAIVVAIARLHRVDQKRRRSVQRQLDATAQLIDSLSDPMLLIDAQRRVVRANAAAVAMFGARAQSRDLAETVRHPELLRAVDAVLTGDGPRTVEFTRPVPIEQVLQAHVQAYDGNPLLVVDGGDDVAGTATDLRSVVVTLHDITTIRRSEQMRADFVANASHELRTPLSTLMGFIETLRGPARDDPDARDRFLGIMDEQANRMSRLVNDLLSLSRIEQDEHMPPLGEVDMGTVVRSVVATLEMRAARRRMRIVVKAEVDLPPVYGDADQLTQVVQNLVDNAINYAAEGTDVVISAGIAPFSHYRGDHAVLLSVADQGEGIPKNHLSRLTERFYRVDPARSRAIGGTGLGLAIVKHIINRHRGRLTVDSDVGKGSVFAVALPAKRPVPAEAQVLGAQ